MKVQLGWMKEFVDVPVETERLAEDLTLAGLAVDAVEGSGDDAVLDLDITTNRVDAMNVYGVAREVSVLYGTELLPLDVEVEETGSPASEVLSVDIQAPDLCPRFTARVLDVRIGASPSWLSDRLEAVGVRPINNIVDLTNYVMMETGQPSHAFDLDRIDSGKLHVRWATEGEKLRTLDEEERVLHRLAGVVADATGGLSLAGIMGGSSSEVSDSTERLALEAAYWVPLAIRRAARSLGMHTEASHRFERGADRNGPLLGLSRIAHLLVKTGAGTVRPGVIDEHPGRREQHKIRLRPSQVDRVLGDHVAEDRQRTILTGLGFAASAGTDRWRVPTWRDDVTREIDLIEEVGRHHGLGRIPSTLPATRAFAGLSRRQTRERRLRRYLVAAGLTELVNHTFVPGNGAEAGVAVANPLSMELGSLRSNLVNGLLDALAANERQGRNDIGVFEIGRVFLPDGDRPREDLRVGILVVGSFEPAHWSSPRVVADVFELKGLVDGMAGHLDAELSVATGDAAEGLHPGRSGRVLLGKEAIGAMGELHPDAVRDRGLKGNPLVLEISLLALLDAGREARRFENLPRFPAVSRDLSLVCDASLPASELAATVRGAAGRQLSSLDFKDRYAGRTIPKGRVGLTLALRFIDPDRTLTGDEVQESMSGVVGALKKLGAEIRGE